MSVMRETPDQRRAKYAWEKVKTHCESRNDFDQYANLAKGAPALIMSNGLMQALAYIYSRKEAEKKALAEDLCEWLSKAMKVKSEKFPDIMTALQTMPVSDYMRATDETLQVLRWLRQFVAVFKSDKSLSGGGIS